MLFEQSFKLNKTYLGPDFIVCLYDVTLESVAALTESMITVFGGYSVSKH